MLRYFPVSTRVFLVTAHRKPRGYIIADKEVKVELKLSRYEASSTSYEVKGWRPKGFNGELGPIYGSRRAAAQALCSSHRFDATDK